LIVPSQTETMWTFIGFRWWQHTIVSGLHGHCTANDVVALDKQSLSPAFNYILQILAIPFKMCRRQIPIQIAFSMTISKFQGQMLKPVGIYLPLPVLPQGHLYVIINRSFSFHSVGVANIEEYTCRQRIENDRLIKSQYVEKYCKFYKKYTNICWLSILLFFVSDIYSHSYS